MPNRVRDRLGMRSLERHVPGQHLVEHDADRPDIGARVRGLPAHLLRRHVGRRAEGRVLRRQLQRIDERRQAEVEDAHAVLGQDHVARLDVAVDDALRVRLGEPVGDLRRDLERLVDRHRPALEPLLQRRPLVERHHDEQLPVVGGLDVVDRADVGMLGGRGRLRLAHEALLGGLVVAPLLRQELQRDEAAELGVARLVDHAHRAAANAGEDLVLGDGPADQRIGSEPS